MIEQPILRELGASGRWLLVSEYEARIPGGLLIVPAGFVCDLASVPDLARVVCDEDELGSAAALCHDWLYFHRGECPVESVVPYQSFTREEADRILYLLALQSGAPRWRSWLAWVAVRAFAGIAWRRRT